MKETRILMGMPVTVQIVVPSGTPSVKDKILETIGKVFNYFDYVDKKFSPFKKSSELSLINKKKISYGKYSHDMREVLRLCDLTKKETDGYFDIKMPDGKIDTSGLVKGWAINNASEIIRNDGFLNYYVDAGGDIQTKGLNEKGEKWRVGIRNPFNLKEIVKIVAVSGEGVATSGTYERGLHIINPKNDKKADEIASITIIGPNIYEADRFATAAFAMGEPGITFIREHKNLEGYMIKKDKTATFTNGFEKYVLT